LRPFDCLQTEDCDENASAHWNQVYINHKTKLFPIKNYIWKCFYELTQQHHDNNEKNNNNSNEQQQQQQQISDKKLLRIVECGCGSGATLFPLVRKNPDWTFYAFDFSEQTVELVKVRSWKACVKLTKHWYVYLFVYLFVKIHQNHQLYEQYKHNIHVFKFDPSQSDAPDLLPQCEATSTLLPNSIDYVLIIFVLSAISPQSKMKNCIMQMKRLLKPGGVILFRDYGLYDHTQLRLPRGSQIYDNYYTRGDKTTCFYFSKEFTQQLFENCGLIQQEISYHCNRVGNKKTGKSMERVFINGRYQKPAL